MVPSGRASAARSGEETNGKLPAATTPSATHRLPWNSGAPHVNVEETGVSKRAHGSAAAPSTVTTSPASIHSWIGPNTMPCSRSLTRANTKEGSSEFARATTWASASSGCSLMTALSRSATAACWPSQMNNNRSRSTLSRPSPPRYSACLTWPTLWEVHHYSRRVVSPARSVGSLGEFGRSRLRRERGEHLRDCRRPQVAVNTVAAQQQSRSGLW